MKRTVHADGSVCPMPEKPCEQWAEEMRGSRSGLEAELILALSRLVRTFDRFCRVEGVKAYDQAVAILRRLGEV